MKLGLVGLGRMGGDMTARLVDRGHEVVGYDVEVNAVDAAVNAGAHAAGSLADLVGALDRPRVAWVMVPHGEPTRATLAALLDALESGDVLIDGGNSHYPDSMQRAAEASGRGVRFLDVGVSGGVWGRAKGYCLMVGGPPDAYEHVEPILAALAPQEGYAHVGPSGAGHFVKMIHNGIEYAMLQALGEGFECLRDSDFGLDLEQVAAVWSHGSVIRSWLLELLERALSEHGTDLDGIGAWVDDSGTGRWTVDYALERSIPVPSLAQALFERFDSRIDQRFAHRAIAALRNQFGGHPIHDGGSDER